jgi:large subunit ribosomal protein L4
MSALEIYNASGKKVKALTLPTSIEKATWSPDLVHQIAVTQQGNRRGGLAKAKDRSEVRGGGKKPWKQKGTGRARHGSTRSPIWVGGGVTHGPTGDRIYTRKINTRMAKRALHAVLNKKASEGELMVLDAFAIGDAKTKQGAAFLKELENAKLISATGTILALTDKGDSATVRALRNLDRVSVMDARNANTVDLLSHKYVLISETSFHGLA